MSPSVVFNKRLFIRVIKCIRSGETQLHVKGHTSGVTKFLPGQQEKNCSEFISPSERKKCVRKVVYNTLMWITHGNTENNKKR